MFNSMYDPRFRHYSAARRHFRDYLRLMRVIRSASTPLKRKATALAAPLFGLDPWTAWKRIGIAYDEHGERADVDGMDLLRNLITTMERHGMRHRKACMTRFAILAAHIGREVEKRDACRRRRRRPIAEGD